MGKLLCSEDDCAPDAYEYFAKEFEKLVGISIYEFKNTVTVIETNYDIIWNNERYRLVYSCDDPFYRLYENY